MGKSNKSNLNLKLSSKQKLVYTLSAKHEKYIPYFQQTET